VVRSKIHTFNVRKTSQQRFREPKPKPSIYQEIVDKMHRLKPGQSFKVPVPKGATPKAMHNRLTAAYNRFEMKPPKGCQFRKRTADDNNVVVYCEHIPK